MLGLSTLGAIHTLISLAALAAGIAALARHARIGMASRAGSAYVWLTVLTCLTGFFLFRHGGFGKPHALGVLVLLVLAVAYLLETGKGLARRPLAAAGLYSFTVFLSLIPAVTETSIRLPVGAPWAASPEDPKLEAVAGALFLAFVVATLLQLRHLRARGSA